MKEAIATATDIASANERATNKDPYRPIAPPPSFLLGTLGGVR